MNWKIRNAVLADPKNTLCEINHSSIIAVQEIVMKTNSDKWRVVLENMTKLRDSVLDAESVNCDFTRVPT